MGIIEKQAVQNAVFSYLGAVLGFITVGLILPNFLTTSENGLLRILISISTLFAQFSSLGVNGITTRLFPYFRNKENKHHGFLFYPIMASLVGFGICVILFFVFYNFIIEKNIEKSKLLVEYIYYLLPLTFFTLFFNVLDAYTRSIYSSVVGTFLKEFLQRIFILAAVGLYYFYSISFSWFVFAYVVAVSLPTLIIAAYIIQQKEWAINPKFSFVNRKMAYEMVSISLFSILTSFSFVTISTIDSIIINDKLGLDATGIYGITFYFGTIIIIPARSILRISSSILAEAWKHNDIELINKIYHKSCINQLIIGALFLLGIWANVDNVLKFLPPEYVAGKYVILFIGIGNLIDMATGLNGAIIATSKYYRYDSFFMLFLVAVTIITNLIFIPIYGIVGSAIASSITILSFNTIRYLFIYIKFKMQPFDIQTLKVLIIIIITYLTNLAIPKSSNFIVDIIIRSTIICLVFSVLIIKARVSPDVDSKVSEYSKVLKDYKKRK